LRPRLEWSVWRSLILAGLPMAGSVILLNIQLRADVLLLSIIRDAREVGLYDAPVKLYEFVFVIPYLFGGLMMPLFVRDLDSGRGSFAPRLSAVIGLGLIFSTLVFAVFNVYAEEIVVLIAGSAFAASAEPLQILAVAVMFAGISAIVRFAAVALDQQARMLRADIIGACAAILAHCLLIPRYGVMGAAVGKLCGDVVTAAAALALFRHQFRKSVFGSALAAVISGAGLIAALSFADNNGMHWLIACAVCLLLVTGLLLLVPRIREDLRCLTTS